MRQVLCIGEALIDVYPEKENIIKKIGGAPLNVAVSINHLTKNCYLNTAIGNDENGKLIQNLLNKFEINNKFITIVPDLETSTATVTLDENGERDFHFKLAMDEFISTDLEAMEEIDIFHFGSATTLKHPVGRDKYFDLLKKVKAKNKFIVFDPNYRKALWTNDLDNFIKLIADFVADADLIKFSEEELEIFTQTKTLAEGVEVLKEEGMFLDKIFLITLGSKGTFLLYHGQEKLIKVVSEKKVIDTTGAGDAFIASVISQISTLDGKISFEKTQKIIKKANEYAKECVKYKGALTFIENK